MHVDVVSLCSSNDCERTFLAGQEGCCPLRRTQRRDDAGARDLASCRRSECGSQHGGTKVVPNVGDVRGTVVVRWHVCHCRLAGWLECSNGCTRRRRQRMIYGRSKTSDACRRIRRLDSDVRASHRQARRIRLVRAGERAVLARLADVAGVHVPARTEVAPSDVKEAAHL